MVIGIPMSTSKIQYYINQAYADYVREAGFEPLTINPKNNAVLMAGICDGLILPGGIDVDPTYYGIDNYSSFAVDPEKDMFERELFYQFVGAGKPIFGICRGLQLIARELLASFGIGKRLRFRQHVRNHALNTDLDLARNIVAHSVQARKSLLYGPGHAGKYTRMFVNSMHHQCLSYTHAKGAKVEKESKELLGLGFEILARTVYGLDEDDEFTIIEAFRMKWEGSKILAVQWHPEEMKDYLLLENFFTEEGEAIELEQAVELGV